MFEGIYALPPGYTLIFEQKKLSINQYWDLQFREDSKTVQAEEEYREQLEILLKEAVRIRLMSDVPFGAFLSGGVDSSTIVALMSHFLDEPVKTFSVGYKDEGKELSELPYARLVAQKYNTDHHEILVSAQDFINLAEKVVWHLDQPIADQAALATYMLSDYASNHVKMVLTGEGGDELFAGYARYVGERFSQLFQHIPGSLKKTALAMSEYIPGLRRPKLALYALCQKDELSRYTNWFPLANDTVKATLLTDDFKNELGNISASAAFAEHLERTDAIDSINRMLYVDSKLWLPDDLLARGDKTSMAASIEARVPILDHKLVEFAASLPVHLKLNRLKRKYLLREASKKWLPPEIINRKKKGFPMPVSTWFRHQAREFVQDILAPTTIKKRNLFEPCAIDKVLAQHKSGFADHGTLIWALINVELWYQRFIDA
jgi:asparagine synthase (glutamine-hydrolysing)